MGDFRVINIVDNAQTVNFGIWNSAIATAKHLQNHQVVSELWFPTVPNFNEIDAIDPVQLSSIHITAVEKLIEQRHLDIRKTVFFTHGAWQFPTRWGAYFRKKGFKWVYSPHGMLEPWSMSQKKLKKTIYLNLFERRMGKQADVIRAVSKIEMGNLKKYFPKKRIIHIPNGVDVVEAPAAKKNDVINFLFLARLHFKKGVLPMVEAWTKSSLNNSPSYNLLIAGPDQGELERIQPYLDQSNNIKYLGSVYGEEKKALFERCHFYLLPSYSEGFPTSVLEAMQYGLIPIISSGTNFPEVHENGLALKAEPDTAMLIEVFNKIKQEPYTNLSSNACKCFEYVQAHFSLKNIAKQQLKLMHELLD
ncbi:glycosyltransferase [Niastella sp. OAS944]|uniref:glycosyltransferase n=1 Tax=Niastella sp. OAS944 TaxID=2664089 RepID=UPI00347FFF61|nr:glycosyltransferase involved in cell wall biosynthesis [Chitinophagaceae bacterium OAS944]